MWLIFAGVLHSFYTFTLLFLAALRTYKNTPRELFLALIVLTFTCLDIFVPRVFPFNMGYPTLWSHLPWSQNADLIGFQGLGFFIYSINALLLAMSLYPQKKRIVGLSALTVFSVLNVAGLIRESTIDEGDQRLKVRVVQANLIPFSELRRKLGPQFQPYVLDTYARMSDDSVSIKRNLYGDAQDFEKKVASLTALPEKNQFDITLWPETALPIYLNEKSIATQKIQLFVDFHNRPVLTGGYGHGENKEELNTAAMFSPGSAEPQVYHKRQLMPFGEYFPLISSMNQWWLPSPSAVTSPGSLDGVMDVSGVKAGVTICYEGIHTQWMTDQVRKGSQILFNLTNDHWFGNFLEPDQHLYMTLGRAIELRRPLIRATLTGFSSAITAKGRILYKSPLGKTDISTISIPFSKNTNLSFYAWSMEMQRFAWGGVTFLLFILALVRRDGRKEHH